MKHVRMQSKVLTKVRALQPRQAQHSLGKTAGSFWLCSCPTIAMKGHLHALSKGLCGLGTISILSHLDVSMNDPSAVQVRQPLEHLLHDGSYLHFSQALQVFTNKIDGMLRSQMLA